ncbi:hypothetical protein L3Q67_31815 [Saccharothrix sp. AJ9571]|nr:hypothetical protein L3Q67_31815 [Saccharothrix sp. AJ9571]
MLVGALLTQARLGHVDPLSMALAGVACGAGPLTLALVFFRPDGATD